jgi:hypothetical protein
MKELADRLRAMPKSYREKAIECFKMRVDLDMWKEADRLRTYDTWSVSFMNKNDLAAAGFYFTGREDVVRCTFCGVQVGRREPGDDPFKDHKRLGRCCEFISGYYSKNIHISSDDQP